MGGCCYRARERGVIRSGFKRGCRETRCVGVFVDAVEEAFDDAEGDEATDVDVG